MKHEYYRLHALTLAWHNIGREILVAMFLVLAIVSIPVSAVDMRFRDRSLYINSATPGATTSYTISFRYMSPEPVGSVDLLFCIDPIPHHECVVPPGLDASNAVLSEQSGETGFSILSKTTDHIVLTRTPGVVGSSSSSYTFDNIVNPDDTSTSFSIRLRSHSTSDASGPQVDFGSVKGQVTNAIELQTQVPPMLIFCVAEEVHNNCVGTNDVYYSDMGILDPQTTLKTQSQMAVGTNATQGFTITANGSAPSAGTNVIDGLEEPTESLAGNNQFGINLVANTNPEVGNDPQGDWTNAVPTPEYNIPDQYKYVPGDVVAYSPNVSLMKKFTVSYIINSSPDLRAGVYSTTINYVASGRF